MKSRKKNFVILMEKLLKIKFEKIIPCFKHSFQLKCIDAHVEINGLDPESFISCSQCSYMAHGVFCTIMKNGKHLRMRWSKDMADNSSHPMVIVNTYLATL